MRPMLLSERGRGNMRAKTRCIISILLLLLPVVPVVCSLAGKLLYAYDRIAGSAAAYLGWLVCNIAALCVLHRETRAERKT